MSPAKQALTVIFFIAIRVAAQTPVTNNNDGTSGTIPAYSGSATLGNSPISISGSNVGIGTASPSTALEVNGYEQVDGPSGALSYKVGSSFSDLVNNSPWYGMGDSSLTLPGAGGGAIQLAGYYGLNLQTAGGEIVVTQQGNVGIGTTNSAAPLQIYKGTSGGLGGNIVLDNIGNSVGDQTGIIFSDGNNGALSSFARAEIISTVENSPYYGNLAFSTGVGSSVTEKLRITGNGNVGIGTTSPGAKLEVDGSVLLTSGSGASITFPNGTVQSTAWNGVLSGGDYAEAVDVSGNRTGFEPGDVLVADPGVPGKFLKSNEPYSTLVGGIYATKPGALGRRQTIVQQADTTEVPMAMVGIVPTKVSTENGPIKIGDLLVTSSTVGYAMRGTDRSLMLGAVVGKALAPLDTDSGVIEVLVTLQ